MVRCLNTGAGGILEGTDIVLVAASVQDPVLQGEGQRQREAVVIPEGQTYLMPSWLIQTPCPSFCTRWGSDGL